MFSFLKDTVSLTYYTASRLFNKNQDSELVLVYHSIGNMGRLNDLYKMNVKISLFQQQIHFLTRYNKQDMIITFDDGFANFFDIALPLISKYNIKIILFVTVGFIEGNMTFDHFFNRKFRINPLSWKQIKEIADSGIEIGSHSLTHPNLAELDYKTACSEITGSKKKIEDIIGKKVRYFAYPYGSRNTFNQQIKTIIENSGYEKAYTNIMGFNNLSSDRYELKRIRIYSDDNMFRFRIKINGAYNWVDKC